MKFTNFLDRILYRDIVTNLIPGALASSSLLLFDEPRNFLMTSFQKSSVAISPPLVAFIAFSAFYAVGFITWLLPFAIQSRLGWTKVTVLEEDLIGKLILRELKNIYGTDEFEKRPGRATWLSILWPGYSCWLLVRQFFCRSNIRWPGYSYDHSRVLALPVYPGYV